VRELIYSRLFLPAAERHANRPAKAMQAVDAAWCGLYKTEPKAVGAIPPLFFELSRVRAYCSGNGILKRASSKT